MIMLAVISRITSACTRRVLRAWAATSNDRFWLVDLPETTFRYGSGCDGRTFSFIARKLTLKVRCTQAAVRQRVIRPKADVFDPMKAA
jgi:hypothetical protein